MNNFFNDIDLSTDKQSEEFFTDLVERAVKGKQSNFEFIRSLSERLAVKTYCFGVEAIIKIFTNLYDSTYKTYVSQVRAGNQDLQTLLALKQFRQCLCFYRKERDIARDMIDEYWEYILSWHIIDTLIGNYRPVEDLWDHRGKNPNGK
jgi:hypothetical protein